ncbi:MAG: hypothetical protein ABIQ39_04560, partial [Ilumatobacteraceae bacterium]
PELDRSSLFHNLIRDAIADRDGARAGRLMNEHILQGRDVLLASMLRAAEEPLEGHERGGRRITR